MEKETLEIMHRLQKILQAMDPNLLRLVNYAKPYKWLIFLACIYMVGAASMSSLTATLLGKLTDKGFYDQEAWVIVAAPAALIGVTLLYAVSTVMSTYTLTKVSQLMLVKLRMQLFEKILHWPFERYQKYSTGLVSSKFVNEANMALGSSVSAVIVLFRDSLQVIALFGILLWQNWMLTLVACIVGPIAAVVLQAIRRRMKRIVRQNQEAIAGVLSRVQESYGAERLVKVSNTYDYEAERFRPINNMIRNTELNMQKMRGLGTPVTQVVTMVGVAVVVAVALVQAQQGLLTIGEFITFLSAMLLLMPPLQNLSGLNATFTAISVAAKSLFTMLDESVEVDNGTYDLKNPKGQIDFENVRLRYPGTTEDAIKPMTIHIRPGEHVALVGLSGSGKTSLVHLVPRFWDVTEGAVLIDGHDVRDCTLKSLRDNVSIVSQNVVLFDTSIGENIRYGMPNATDEDVNAAVEAAALGDFIRSLPQGLNSPVGEGGALLSGGQKQRVSIARALLKNAPILILDEATSALDSESEAKIKDALARLMEGRTTLVVAHRLSTIDNADRIIVMNRGDIVEQGAPAELIAKDGTYARLCRLQSGAANANPA